MLLLLASFLILAYYVSQVERQDAPWLNYEGKWGGDVEAPQKQEWFARAENPVSRTWIQQVWLKLPPSISASAGQHYQGHLLLGQQSPLFSCCLKHFSKSTNAASLR